jgi:hypothetical protein
MSRPLDCKPSFYSERRRTGLDRHIFIKRLLFRRAPAWVQCELCQRSGEPMPERFVVAMDAADTPQPIESKLTRQLCVDCSALVDGVIDTAEWKRRTNFRAT